MLRNRGGHHRLRLHWGGLCYCKRRVCCRNWTSFAVAAFEEDVVAAAETSFIAAVFEKDIDAADVLTRTRLTLESRKLILQHSTSTLSTEELSSAIKRGRVVLEEYRHKDRVSSRPWSRRLEQAFVVSSE